MNNKIFVFFILVLLLITMSSMLFSCQEKHFTDYEIGEIVTSNRDGCVRKIDEDFFVEINYRDSFTQVYLISPSVKKEHIGYAVVAIENTLLCDGHFDKYGSDEKSLYLFDSIENTVTIIDKESKQFEEMSALNFEKFELIEWQEV